MIGRILTTDVQITNDVSINAGSHCGINWDVRIDLNVPIETYMRIVEWSSMVLWDCLEKECECEI